MKFSRTHMNRIHLPRIKPHITKLGGSKAKWSVVLYKARSTDIENIMGDNFTTNQKSYWALCDDVLSAYDQK